MESFAWPNIDSMAPGEDGTLRNWSATLQEYQLQITRHPNFPMDREEAAGAIIGNRSGRLPSYYSPEYRITGTILHVILLIFGTLGNLLVVVVVVRRRFLQTPVNYYLVSLAAADILVLVSSIPDTIASYFRPEHVWVLGEIGCQSLIFFQYLGINASSASMVAFTLERYFAVCRPRLVGYEVSVTKIRCVIIFIWISTSLYCSPWFFLTEIASMNFDVEGYRDAKRCHFRLSPDQYAYVFIGDLLLFYIIPLAICSVLYFKMGLVLYKCTKRYSIPGVSYTTSGNAETELCDLSSNVRRPSATVDGDRAQKIMQSRTQVVRMLALVVLLFAVLSVPYRGLMVYNCFAKKPWLDLWYLLFAKSFVFLNSAINPVLYNAMSSRFRMAFRSMLSCEAQPLK